jgi:branched-subunit amino acid ABC-type transport system permease component
MKLSYKWLFLIIFMIAIIALILGGSGSVVGEITGFIIIGVIIVAVWYYYILKSVKKKKKLGKH